MFALVRWLVSNGVERCPVHVPCSMAALVEVLTDDADDTEVNSYNNTGAANVVVFVIAGWAA
jgi:hypothetical protein